MLGRGALRTSCDYHISAKFYTSENYGCRACIAVVIAEVVHDVRSFRFDTATERYEKLISVYPRLVQRVPQYMVASYLGVTPESLSRIRAKLIKS